MMSRSYSELYHPDEEGADYPKKLIDLGHSSREDQNDAVRVL
jgi:hypothetical protein